MIFRRIALIAVILPLALIRPATAQEAPKQDLSLKMDLGQTVQRALDANPQIVSAKHQIGGAVQGVRASVAAFGPVGTASYTSTAGHSRVSSNVLRPASAVTQDSNSVTPTSGTSGHLVDTTDYQATLDLNVHQPLFTGFRLLSTYQKSRLAKDQAEALYRQTELTLVNSVQTAFLTLLQARANVKSNQDSVARLESQLKVTKAFYDAGLRPKLDVLQAQSDLSTATEGLLAAQNAVEIQLAQLDSLLDISQDQRVEYVGELTQVPFQMSLQAALDEAYKDRPDIDIAIKSVEMAQKDAHVALSPALPQVSADYDYIREGDKWWLRAKNTPIYDRHQFTLSLTWRAWDWGNTYFSYRQADENVKKLEADLATLRLNVGAAVKTQYLNIQDAAKRIVVAKTGLAASQEAYRTAIARYQAQVGTSTDVLVAQAQLTNAEFLSTQALTDYQIAIANLNVAIGRKNLTLN